MRTEANLWPPGAKEFGDLAARHNWSRPTTTTSSPQPAGDLVYATLSAVPPTSLSKSGYKTASLQGWHSPAWSANWPLGRRRRATCDGGGCPGRCCHGGHRRGAQSSSVMGSSSLGSAPMTSSGLIPPRPTSWRTFSEISIIISRFSARKVFAFSRPWPSCSPW